MKKLIVLILVFAILMLTCSGCSSAAAAAAAAATAGDPLTTYKHSDRFTVERYYYGDRTMPDCYVITDTETGTQYLACTWHNSAGLTVLQPGED